MRTVGIDYWFDENFKFDENKLKNLKCDIVVSHSAPSVCFPNSNIGLLKLCGYDANLYSELILERSELNLALDILKENNNITNWYYGHFHKNNKDYIDGIIFECLDELSFSII